MISLELHCKKCDWWTLCGEGEMVRRLRLLGVLRRAANPPEEIVRELIASRGAELACDRCAAKALTISDSSSESDGEWDQARVCEICRQVISEERLEYSPSAKRCTACQDKTDRGHHFVEPDFCTKCGSLLELRVSKARGITRYRFFCTGSPPCRL